MIFIKNMKNTHITDNTQYVHKWIINTAYEVKLKLES